MLDRLGAVVAVASAVSATVFLALIADGAAEGTVANAAAWLGGGAVLAACAWAGVLAWRARRFGLAAPAILAGAFGSAWLGLVALAPVALAFVAAFRAVRARPERR